MTMTELLFPTVAGVRVIHIEREREGSRLCVHVSMTRRRARCPLCHTRSVQIHSRYVRHLSDLPLCGSAVMVLLHTRRFFCRRRECPRRIFTERLPALVAPSARRTLRQRVEVQALGFALGGEAGARQAARQGITISPATLLTLVRAAPSPEMGQPRVLGVDDFAVAKGQRYGTILVDLEKHRVLDLLADRSAETLAAWLRAHPSVEVISRDRAGVYADGARRGAPAAIQVADRWHILHNLVEAIERFLSHQHAALRAAEQAGGPARPDVSASGSCALLSADDVPPAPEKGMPGAHARGDHDARDRRARRHGRYAEVIALQHQGVGVREIARRLHMGRATVRRFVRAGAFPERALPAARPTLLQRYEPYLRERWNAGCQNATLLWREIQAQGFAGSARAVREYLAGWRAEPGRPGRPAKTPRPSLTVAPPARRARSPRQTVWLLLRCPEDLEPEDRAFVEQLCHLCPAVARVQGLAQDFFTFMRTQNLAALKPWLHAADLSGVPEIDSFVTGLRGDRAAVEAALTLPWSQGQTEGQVNRVKMIKRMMFGRAAFALLRRRVLPAA